MIKKKTQGQSLIEVVFLIGALALVLTGGVALLVNSLNARTRGFDRKKASELGTYVIEGLVNVKENQPDVFWPTKNISVGTTDPKYPSYTYDVVFTDVSGTYQCTRTVCAEAVVTVSWATDVTQKVIFTRLFAR